MRNPMFVYDEQLTDLIFDYCRWRLSLDPVPLDFGGAVNESLASSLEGLMTEGGVDPALSAAAAASAPLHQSAAARGRAHR